MQCVAVTQAPLPLPPWQAPDGWILPAQPSLTGVKEERKLIGEKLNQLAFRQSAASDDDPAFVHVFPWSNEYCKLDPSNLGSVSQNILQLK